MNIKLIFVIFTLSCIAGYAINNNELSTEIISNCARQLGINKISRIYLQHPPKYIVIEDKYYSYIRDLSSKYSGYVFEFNGLNQIKIDRKIKINEPEWNTFPGIIDYDKYGKMFIVEFVDRNCWAVCMINSNMTEYILCDLEKIITNKSKDNKIYDNNSIEIKDKYKIEYINKIIKDRTKR